MGELILFDKLNVNMRWLVSRDISHLVLLDNDSFWGWDSLEFKNFKKNEDNIILVGDYGNMAVGYIAVETYEDSIRIVNISVARALRRRSIGNQLLSRICNIYAKTRDYIFCEMPESNLGGQLFLKSTGFKARKILPNFWEYDNAYLFTKKLKQL